MGLVWVHVKRNTLAVVARLILWDVSSHLLLFMLLMVLNLKGTTTNSSDQNPTLQQRIHLHLTGFTSTGSAVHLLPTRGI